MYSNETCAIVWFMMFGFQKIVKLLVEERMEALLFPLGNLIPIYITWNNERGSELLVTSLTV
jgi:hypothetical protein